MLMPLPLKNSTVVNIQKIQIAMKKMKKKIMVSMVVQDTKTETEEASRTKKVVKIARTEKVAKIVTESKPIE
jgi:hypothetical protein